MRELYCACAGLRASKVVEDSATGSLKIHFKKIKAGRNLVLTGSFKDAASTLVLCFKTSVNVCK